MDVMNVIGISIGFQPYPYTTETTMTPDIMHASGAQSTMSQWRSCTSTTRVTITLSVLVVLTLSLELMN